MDAGCEGTSLPIGEWAFKVVPKDMQVPAWWAKLAKGRPWKPPASIGAVWEIVDVWSGPLCMKPRLPQGLHWLSVPSRMDTSTGFVFRVRDYPLFLSFLAPRPRSAPIV